MGQGAFLFFCAVFFLVPTVLAGAKPPEITEQVKSSIVKPLESGVRSPKIAVAGVAIAAATTTPVVATSTPTLPPTFIPSPGQSVKVNDTTWRITVPQDTTMGTQAEVFAALNSYRQKKGQAQLLWDDKLGSYAQSRADFFAANGSMDGHLGFNNYISNQNGFNALGFSSLGENSAFLGGTIEATRIIEVIFAGDVPHDSNQLDSKWSHAGVGVHGQAVDVVFGGRKQ